MTIFADQFAAMLRAKVNSVATHRPEPHMIDGLFDCHRSEVPVLPFAAPVPTGAIEMDVAGRLT